MNKAWIVIGVIVALVFIAFGWYQNGYNTIIALDQNVSKSWAQVESQLQRRFDLIPNLVNTVKGYSDHEKTILEDVTRLRSQWAQAPSVSEKVEAANALTGALSKLMVITENYPNLKANENYLALQSQLEGTENRIAVERMRYNEAVSAFNAYQQSFMGRFFASATGKTQPAVFYKAAEVAATAPVVKF